MPARSFPTHTGTLSAAKFATEPYGASEDIANAVAFLASAKAKYITGSTLTIDGGANA
jgi:3-oxoacyl-[acyl-carrier protein] reductase